MQLDSINKFQNAVTQVKPNIHLPQNSTHGQVFKIGKTQNYNLCVMLYTGIVHLKRLSKTDFSRLTVVESVGYSSYRKDGRNVLHQGK